MAGEIPTTKPPSHTRNRSLSRRISMAPRAISELGLGWSARYLGALFRQRLFRSTHSAAAHGVLGSVVLEVTTYCNLKCAGCSRTVHDQQDNWQNRHMAVEDFRAIISTLPLTTMLNLVGIGEPTMHPRLPELIALARASRKFAKITLTSNATFRSLEYYAELFAAGLTGMIISVDSLDPHQIELLRAGTSVERLKKNIRALGQRFDGKIVIDVTVGKFNFRSIDAILSELSRLGSFHVRFHAYDDVGNAAGCLTDEDRLWFEHRIAHLRDAYEHLTLGDTSLFFPSTGLCEKPWKHPAITVDGDLTPCCRILDKDVYTFGNLISHQFDEVWSAPKAEQFRATLLKKTPSICASCPWFVTRAETPSLSRESVPVEVG